MPSIFKGRGDDARPSSRSLAAHLIRGLWIFLGLIGVVAFAVVIARLTLSPQPGASKYVHDNTHPGETLRLYLDRPSVKVALLQLGGNFVLLMPLGVLLPVLSARLRGPLRILLAVGVISLCVETVQGALIAGRAFDADDVILNTAGALVAYLLIGRRIARWAHPAA
jgi:VanZ family protein